MDSTLQLEKGSLSERELDPSPDPDAVTEENTEEDGGKDDADGEGEEDDVTDDEDDEDGDEDEEEEDAEDGPDSKLNETLAGITSAINTRLQPVQKKYETFKQGLSNDKANGFKDVFQAFDKATKLFDSVFGIDETSNGTTGTNESLKNYNEALQSTATDSWLSMFSDTVTALLSPQTDTKPDSSQES